MDLALRTLSLLAVDLEETHTKKKMIGRVSRMMWLLLSYRLWLCWWIAGNSGLVGDSLFPLPLLLLHCRHSFLS